jgi:hypothetical protein
MNGTRLLWIAAIAGGICLGDAVGAWAQIAIGGQPSNVPLSQQALQEMQQTGGSVLSGTTVNFLRVADDVTVPPIESIKNLFSLGAQDNPSNQRKSFSVIVTEFKEQQRQQLNSSNSIFETLNRLPQN